VGKAVFFVLEPEVIDHIADDSTIWAQEPLRTLAHIGQLSAYKHSGFWQSINTLRDKTMWRSFGTVVTP